MSTESIEARVARGVALLDEKLPGWIERIDLDKLDLASGCNCILGQTWSKGDDDGRFTAFELQADALGLYGEDENDYGFNAGGEDYFEDRPEYDALTAEWRRVILARRGGAS